MKNKNTKPTKSRTKKVKVSKKKIGDDLILTDSLINSLFTNFLLTDYDKPAGLIITIECGKNVPLYTRKTKFYTFETTTPVAWSPSAKKLAKKRALDLAEEAAKESLEFMRTFIDCEPPCFKSPGAILRKIIRNDIVMRLPPSMNDGKYATIARGEVEWRQKVYCTKRKSALF